MWDRGYLGFFDLKQPFAPLITEGIEVLDPSSVQGVERGGTHSILDDHPLIRDAEWVLDIGCGTGWSSPSWRAGGIASWGSTRGG